MSGPRRPNGVNVEQNSWTWLAKRGSAPTCIDSMDESSRAGARPSERRRLHLSRGQNKNMLMRYLVRCGQAFLEFGARCDREMHGVENGLSCVFSPSYTQAKSECGDGSKCGTVFVDSREPHHRVLYKCRRREVIHTEALDVRSVIIRHKTSSLCQPCQPMISTFTSFLRFCLLTS